MIIKVDRLLVDFVGFAWPIQVTMEKDAFKAPEFQGTICFSLQTGKDTLLGNLT